MGGEGAGEQVTGARADSGALFKKTVTLVTLMDVSRGNPSLLEKSLELASAQKGTA